MEKCVICQKDATDTHVWGLCYSGQLLSSTITDVKKDVMGDSIMTVRTAYDNARTHVISFCPNCARKHRRLIGLFKTFLGTFFAASGVVLLIIIFFSKAFSPGKGASFFFGYLGFAFMMIISIAVVCKASRIRKAIRLTEEALNAKNDSRQKYVIYKSEWTHNPLIYGAKGGFHYRKAGLIEEAK